jgi:dihydroxyacetone kinase
VTRLFNEPADFADEMTRGLLAAYGDRLLAAPGGVVSRAAPAPGTVAVVVGGGSGHYPAFGGLVGPGLAAGAAMGNLFASPSAQQVHGVSTAAHSGGGVLLSYGNYAGDVLNFDAAQERLRAEGIDCRTVVVTDDVSSAAVHERHRRRGVAGDLAVFKVAGAAAAEGLSLDEVERLARRANDRTRSFGVAFSGCTLPGAGEPLFTVPAGRMALGLGIHGEPGLGEVDVPSADGLAEILVDRLLSEIPDGVGSLAGARVAVILNGLGSVKYEELFVVFNRVGILLTVAGLELIEPDVGEFCTSLDMAGVSLTLLWLDDELERLWRAPADSPAYRKGAVGRYESRTAMGAVGDLSPASVPPASDGSRERARVACAALDATSAIIDLHADELGRIDAVAGDGDHGIGMQRGARASAAAAREAFAAGAGIRTVLERAGDAWADRAGGTSGALWGLGLRTLGGQLADDLTPRAADLAAGVDAAVEAIRSVGGASVGDKTMVDALVPFRDELVRGIAAGEPLRAAWSVAAAAADRAAADTSDLLPRRGRARPHAERSLGTPDAGAHSFALIVNAITDELPARPPRED